MMCDKSSAVLERDFTCLLPQYSLCKSGSNEVLLILINGVCLIHEGNVFKSMVIRNYHFVFILLSRKTHIPILHMYLQKFKTKMKSWIGFSCHCVDHICNTRRGTKFTFPKIFILVGTISHVLFPLPSWINKDYYITVFLSGR